MLIENHGLYSSDGKFIAGIMKEVNLPNFGTLPDFGNWCTNAKWGSTQKNKCDEVLYIDSDYTKKELFQLWELSRIFGLRYRYITNSFDITKTNTSLSLIHNIPVIELENTSLNNW